MATNPVTGVHYKPNVFPTRIEIRYNQNWPDCLIYGFKPTDETKLVATVTIGVHTYETDVDVCERIFRMFNVVEGHETPVVLGIRSMCVGDLVVIDNVVYACQNVGFIKVEGDYPIV